MPAMTPIRVRGKRGATKTEKWHAGKKRKASRDSLPALSAQLLGAVSVSSAAPSTASSRKCKRRRPQLSKLEELPTEILQDIFYYSANIDLALASPGLQAQLSSPHVYLKHTSRILQPILGNCGNSMADDADLSAAARLLNCKFMTWNFFKLWLDEWWEPQKRPHGISMGEDRVDEYRNLWLLSNPSVGLLPPRKLLHGPWTEDRVNFLRVLSTTVGHLPALSPVLGEIAHEGLGQAVTEGSEKAVSCLLRMGVNRDTEVLRRAVIDYGCNEAIVHALLWQRSSEYYAGGEPRERLGGVEVSSSTSQPADEAAIDYLDQALWSWAEKARTNGDRKGEWLVALLKMKARPLGLAGGTLPGA
ncbi:hypothetical protein LTR85_000341 [Meristemomyces frigidus]|nr:hypothetical protein LTR85_000341 [Meristemomyces frigidus]